MWPDIAARAADHGVRIAIENCPMIFSADEWPGGGNLMSNPSTWRDVFAHLEGDTLGLNLDPSHLVWQMIDHERVVREFADRIYHVHAKDMEIDREGLYEHGVLSAGIGWQATTARWSSSTRTVGSRAATRRSGRASCSPTTRSPPTSSDAVGAGTTRP